MTSEPPLSSHEDVVLRASRDGDLAALERWSADFERESGDDHGPPFLATTYRHFQTHPDRGAVLVIEHAGEPAGFLVFVRFWSNEFRGPCVILDELYLEPRHRGGTGLSVLRAFETLMRAEAIKAIDLEVLHKNPKVHALYRRAGFVNDRVGYIKELK